MSMLDALAAFVSTANASDLPASDRAILRHHVTDVVAARFAGAACSEGRAVAAFYPPGQGADSIAGLATLVRLTETDDIHLASGTTPSSVAVPVALGLAATTPCAPDQLQSAIFVGVETIVRLAMAVGGAGLLYKGIWPTRLGATLGAAATACRVWALSERETRNALSLAALLTSGQTARFHGEPSGRWIIFSVAVGDGIRAALAARAGYLGGESIRIDQVSGEPVDVQLLVRNLGRTSVFPELSLKPYCTSRQALPGAEAMRALVAQGLDPAAIEAFTIKVPAAYAAMIGQKLDRAIHSSSYVSGAGMAAIAALDPASLYDVDRSGVIRNPRIIALAGRGEVSAEPDLDRMYPGRWPARIEVKTANGVLRHEVVEPIGDPGNPIGERELADKARRVLASVGRADEAETLLAAAGSAFQTETAVSTLARLFVDGKVP